MKKKIFYGILVLVWMIIIFSFSNQTAVNSSDMTVGLLDRILVFLHLDEWKYLINILFVPVRKMAHFIIYLVLGILVLNFIKEFDLSVKEVLIASIVICILYAVSDEVHQIFVPGRAGMVIDIMIDTLGSVSGLYIYRIINKKI